MWTNAMLDGLDYVLEDNERKELDKTCKDLGIFHFIWIAKS